MHQHTTINCKRIISTPFLTVSTTYQRPLLSTIYNKKFQYCCSIYGLYKLLYEKGIPVEQFGDVPFHSSRQTHSFDRYKHINRAIRFMPIRRLYCKSLPAVPVCTILCISQINSSLTPACIHVWSMHILQTGNSLMNEPKQLRFRQITSRRS